MSDFPSQGQYDMGIHQLTCIFCEVDDFCNTLDLYTKDYMLTGPMKGKRGPSCGLALSEIMTILMMFQSSRMRDFKNFYTGLLTGLTRNSKILPVSQNSRAYEKRQDQGALRASSGVDWVVNEQRSKKCNADIGVLRKS
jgi:hypothetical protein